MKPALGLIFNSVQANTITLSTQTAFGFDRFSTGLILSFLTAIIIFKWNKRIAQVTEWLVPIMATLYIFVALFINTNFSMLPFVFQQIFHYRLFL